MLTKPCSPLTGDEWEAPFGGPCWSFPVQDIPGGPREGSWSVAPSSLRAGLRVQPWILGTDRVCPAASCFLPGLRHLPASGAAPCCLMNSHSLSQLIRVLDLKMEPDTYGATLCHLFCVLKFQPPVFNIVVKKPLAS